MASWTIDREGSKRFGYGADRSRCDTAIDDEPAQSRNRQVVDTISQYDGERSAVDIQLKKDEIE